MIEIKHYIGKQLNHIEFIPQYEKAILIFLPKIDNKYENKFNKKIDELNNKLFNLFDKEISLKNGYIEFELERYNIKNKFNLFELKKHYFYDFFRKNTLLKLEEIKDFKCYQKIKQIYFKAISLYELYQKDLFKVKNNCVFEIHIKKDVISKTNIFKNKKDALNWFDSFKKVN